MFMFRPSYHLENLPDVFENYFVTNNQIHQHNTKNASKLHKVSKPTSYAKYTLHNEGIVWNEPEPKFKDIKNFYIFKKQIKQHITKTHVNSI